MWTYQVLPVWMMIGAIYPVWITGFSKIIYLIYERKKIPGIELIVQLVAILAVS